MTWTIVIVASAVVVVSAAIRLAFYVWWRGRFGGRPVGSLRVRKPEGPVEVIRWEGTGSGEMGKDVPRR